MAAAGIPAFGTRSEGGGWGGPARIRESDRADPPFSSRGQVFSSRKYFLTLT